MKNVGQDTIRISTEILEDMQVRLNKLYSDTNIQSGKVQLVAKGLTRAAGGNLNISLITQLSGGSYAADADVKSALFSIGKILNVCGDETERIKRAVSSTVTLFSKNEKNLSALIGAVNIGVQSKFVGSESNLEGIRTGSTIAKASAIKIDWRFDELFKTLVTSFGTAGSFLYSLSNIGSLPGLVKFLATSGECIAEWKTIAGKFTKLKRFGTAHAVKSSVREMLGLRSYARSLGFNASGAKTLTKRYFSNLSRSGISAFKKGMSSVAAWLTEGIDKGIENYEEYKAGYKDGGTAIAEWATETTLAVAAGAGAIALVGAAIPAAPVVLVGAIGGTIVWGVDTLWANTIGKGQDEDGGNEGLIETLGEGIVEGGKYIAESSYELGERMGDALYDGIEGIKGFLSGDSKISAAWVS